MKVLGCRSLLVILLVGCFSASLTAQTTLLIHDTEAIKHLGQYVTVEGTIGGNAESGFFSNLPFQRSPSDSFRLTFPPAASKAWPTVC
jgi:hypothetical protein